jgi:pyrroline-5-carboxylate reductase
MSMNPLNNIRSICFAGAGSMAEAIIKGLIDTKLLAPEQISAINRSNIARLEELASSYGIQIPTDEADKSRLIREADIVLLAMKPKDSETAITALSSMMREDQLVISVIAGLSINALHVMLGKQLPIVRTMPNTSSTIGLGATGMSFSPQVTEEHAQLARAIFESVGIVRVVDEQLLDAVTGVSGSGPAYIYYVMEAMIQGGIECGLTPDAARELTVQTVLGAARMVQETGEEPAELRRKVTSPNGTTQAALELMASYKLQEAVTNGVKRAAERARELGEQFGGSKA